MELDIIFYIKFNTNIKAWSAVAIHLLSINLATGGHMEQQ